MILSKVAHYGTPLMESLYSHGLHVERGTSFSNLDPDDIKFFLKQQQKRLADSQGTKEESEPGSVTKTITCDVWVIMMHMHRCSTTKLQTSCLSVCLDIVC